MEEIAGREGGTPLGADRVIELVEAVARGLRVSGDLRVGKERHQEAPFGEFPYSDVHVSSTVPGCCPITIAVFEDDKSAGWMTISFGGSYCEIWGKSSEETTATAKDILVAVMDGRYEEWRRPEDTEGQDVFGHLIGSDGAVLHSDFGRTTGEELEQRGYFRHRFSPY